MSIEQDRAPAATRILEAALSKRIARTVHAAAELRIADLLASGPRTVHALARATGTHAPSLYRVLRALASIGIFTETRRQTFRLTPSAEWLKDKPGSLRGLVLLAYAPFHERAWDNLLYCVKTGQTGFTKAHGKPLFKYLARDRGAAAIFNEAMTGGASNHISAIVDAYDFSGISVLTDVGGGHGALVRTILGRYKTMQAIVYDVPEVIAGTRKALRRYGISERGQAIAGDFFVSVPSADAVIMSRIIHDWEDADAIRILRNCRRALRPNGRVLLVETLVPDRNTPSAATFLDIEMMVVAGGRERTREEYARLFRRAGLRLRRIVPAASGVSILEARPLR